MRVDFPSGQPTGVEGNGLLVEAGETPLVLGDQLRLEAAAPVARDVQLELARVGKDGLLAVADDTPPVTRTRGFLFNFVGSLFIRSHDSNSSRSLSGYNRHRWLICANRATRTILQRNQGKTVHRSASEVPRMQ